MSYDYENSAQTPLEEAEKRAYAKNMAMGQMLQARAGINAAPPVPLTNRIEKLIEEACAISGGLINEQSMLINRLFGPQGPSLSSSVVSKAETQDSFEGAITQTLQRLLSNLSALREQAAMLNNRI